VADLQEVVELIVPRYGLVLEQPRQVVKSFMQEMHWSMEHFTYLTGESVLRPYPVGAGVGAEATQLIAGVALGLSRRVNPELQLKQRPKLAAQSSQLEAAHLLRLFDPLTMP
jgi:hypothetical protein